MFVSHSDVEPEVTWPEHMERELNQRYREKIEERLHAQQIELSCSLDQLYVLEEAYARRLLQVSDRHAPAHCNFETSLIHATNIIQLSHASLHSFTTCCLSMQAFTGRQQSNKTASLPSGG